LCAGLIQTKLAWGDGLKAVLQSDNSMRKRPSIGVLSKGEWEMRQASANRDRCKRGDGLDRGRRGACGALGGASARREAEIKIALIADKTGPLEAYAKQTSAGFAMGLDYATGGTMMVAGHKLVVIEKDSQTKPDVGRNLLNEAYNDDGADIAVGGTSSAVALAMLPVAQDNKKIFIVEPAVADSITGAKWNRYIFRTGRNSTQDAASNALAIGKPGTVIATLAQDYAFGRDFVTAFKTALAPTGAKLVFEEYAPPLTTDFTAPDPAHLRCAGQGAGPQDHLRQLGRRQSARGAQGHGTGATGHRDLDRRQHPAGAGRLQGFSGNGGRRLLLLRHSQEPGERRAGRGEQEAVQRSAAGFLHLRRLHRGAGGGRWR
jgi:hypothetical protein